MAFCPSCGAKVGSGIKFCPKCGANTAGGGGAATNINVTHNILSAVCLFAVGAILIYGAVQLAEFRAPAVMILAGIPIAALCFYVGYESFNKKIWAQKWAVVLGLGLFLGNWFNLANAQISILQIIQILAAPAAALFAYLGKDLYTVEDAANPLAKLTL